MSDPVTRFDKMLDRFQPTDDTVREVSIIMSWLMELIKRHITSQDVIDQLFQLILCRGVPEQIRSDNGLRL
ncbi:IS3 family transposase, partial [Chloroflexota bacterium]